jgi:hypothetical protein
MYLLAPDAISICYLKQRSARGFRNPSGGAKTLTDHANETDLQAEPSCGTHNLTERLLRRPSEPAAWARSPGARSKVGPTPEHGGLHHEHRGARVRVAEEDGRLVASRRSPFSPSSVS